MLTGTDLRINQKDHKKPVARKEMFGKTVTGICFTMQYFLKVRIDIAMARMVTNCLDLTDWLSLSTRARRPSDIGCE
jgi:hypothetical protein